MVKPAPYANNYRISLLLLASANQESVMKPLNFKFFFVNMSLPSFSNLNNIMHDIIILYTTKKKMINKCSILKSSKITIILILTFVYSTIGQLYNHNSSNSYRNQSWMGQLDRGIPLRKISMLGTHSSMSQGIWGDAFQAQSLNLNTQLISGIRALDIRCRHKNNRFQIYQRFIDLNYNFDNVLNEVQNFLIANPTETILIHVIEQYDASGNSRSFEDTYIYYRDQFSTLIWQPINQNPTLGETRGKVVIIQNFAGAIHGLLYATFVSLPHKKYTTNWDHYDKWEDTKSFLTSSNSAGQSRISFWTGYFGSFPYFVASGKSSPGNSAPRLSTGLTTPGFKSYYPDFPRVACFIGICTIAFEGINKLSYSYFTSQGYSYLGIVFTDFFGDTLVQEFIKMNLNLFGKCTTTQVAGGCTVCSKSGNCLVCDTALHYIYNSVTLSCDAQVGFYLSPTPLLCSSSIEGCLECNSAAVCTLCDTYAHYVLEPSTGLCAAEKGYYLDTNSIPQICSAAIVGCQECSSSTVCTQCSDINNFVAVGNICQCDTVGNFVLTPNNISCVCSAGLFLNMTVTPPTCDSIPVCPDANSGCLNCSGSVCLVCDESNSFVLESPLCYCQEGYFYNGVSCDLCNSTLGAECATCATQFLCLSCIDNFTLLSGSCVCLPQFYQFDSDTCLSCPIGCLGCSSDTVCTKCDEESNFKMVGTVCECKSGMFLTIPDMSCELCSSMPGCIDCTMTGCLACDPIFGFTLDTNTSICICNIDSFANEMNICEKCSQEGCLACDSRTDCSLCDTTLYYLSNSDCLDICGDGKLVNLECDDGNRISGDGCSQQCLIQTYYACTGGSKSSPSACSFSGEINMKLQNYVKEPLSNKFVANFSLQPNLPILKNMNFSQTISTNFPFIDLQVTFDDVAGFLIASFTYNQSLNAREDLQVTINPPDTPQFLHTPNTSIRLLGTTFNNLALLHYPDEVYQTEPILQTLITVLTILSLCVFAAGFFISKIIVIEFIGVFQLSFLGLMMIQRMQAFLLPAYRLIITNGYNMLLQENNSVLPYRISSVGYNSTFISNFNIMSALILIPLIAGLAFLIYARLLETKYEDHHQRQVQMLRNDDSGIATPKQSLFLKSNGDDQQKIYSSRSQQRPDREQPKQKKYNRFGFLLLKEYFLTALLFISYQVIVCLGIAFLYNADFTVALGVLILLSLIVFSFLLYFKPENFGEYKQMFGEGILSRNYYILVILLRLVVGFSIILPDSPTVSVCLVLAFNVFSLLINIIIRPYRSNIRPILNSLILVMVFSIYSVYGLNLVDNPQWSTTNLPIFLYAGLGLCLISTIVFLTIHVYQICKHKKGQKQYEKEMQKTKQLVKELKERNACIPIDNATMTMTPNKDVFVDPHKQIVKELKREIMIESKLQNEEMSENVNQLYEEI